MKNLKEPRTRPVSLVVLAKAGVVAVALGVACAVAYAQSGTGTSTTSGTPTQTGTSTEGGTSTPGGTSTAGGDAPTQGGRPTSGGPGTAWSVIFTPNDNRPTPGWTLTPTFVFSQASDSNITLAGQGTPTVGDNVAALTPSVDLSYFGRTTSFNGGYSGSATRYFTVNQLDTFDQRLYADFAQQVTRRFQLFAHDSAGWLPATDTIMLTGVPFGRVGSRIESLDTGGTILVTQDNQITAGYRYERVNFDRDPVLGSQLLGGTTNGVYGTYSHQVNARLAIGGSGDIRRALVGGGLQTFDMQNAEGNFTFRVSPVFSISGGVGFARIAGSLLDQGSRVGPAFHGNGTYRFQRVLVYGSYLRSYVPSYGIGGTMQNQELSAGATVPVAFRDRLIVGGNFAWRRNDPLDQTFSRLTSRWLNAYASYGFAPWLRLEGFYTRDTQDSHLGGVLRNRVGVQVVADAPLRFR